MISFLLPTRNTLFYTQLAYSSLRKYNPDAEIVILDDLSNDGTIEWLKNLKDDNVVKWFNDPVNFPRTYDDQKFSGHTLTYNIGATLAKGPLIGIFHSDMVCTENYTKNLLKHWKPKTIVSATRIEPPVYPSDPIKFTKDFGVYIEDFKQEEMESFVKEKEVEFKDKTSPNFFAPWIISQNEYCDIGGMDPIFAPYPIEDSDFIERLYALGYDIKQSWDAICYHWCSRGHRWTTGVVQVDTDEFKRCQHRSLTNFYQKWGKWPDPPAHNFIR
jgi:glycosyltransferase involved in cell wall biosynthesis